MREVPLGAHREANPIDGLFPPALLILILDELASRKRSILCKFLVTKIEDESRLAKSRPVRSSKYVGFGFE
jgi:hypothetical protein